MFIFHLHIGRNKKTSTNTKHRQTHTRLFSVCLFVSRITQKKLVDRFSQNLAERWHMDHGRTHEIFITRIMLH